MWRLEQGPFSFFLMFLVLIIGIMGLVDDGFYKKHVLHPKTVTKKRSYRRILTSGFIHPNWRNLMVNVLGIYCIMPDFEDEIGTWKMVLLYFIPLIVGNLLVADKFRKKLKYQTMGAQGGILGVSAGYLLKYPLGGTFPLYFDPLVEIEIRFYIIPLVIAYFLLNYLTFKGPFVHRNIQSYIWSPTAGLITIMILHPKSVMQYIW